jgi:hypothetical protein
VNNFRENGKTKLTINTFSKIKIIYRNKFWISVVLGLQRISGELVFMCGGEDKRNPMCRTKIQVY